MLDGLLEPFGLTGEDRGELAVEVLHKRRHRGFNFVEVHGLSALLKFLAKVVKSLRLKRTHQPLYEPTLS